MNVLKVTYIVGLLFFTGGTAVFSQYKYTKEQKMLLREANYYYKITDYMGALNIFNELYQHDNNSSELSHKIGVCIFKTGGNKLEAAQYLKRAGESGYVESYYYLARFYHLQNKFDKAIELYHQYKNAKGKKQLDNSQIDRYIDISVRARDMISEPVYVEIKNMGAIINSAYSDYRPIISADESVLIFTSRRDGSTGGQLDPYNHYFEDIYISYKVFTLNPNEEEQWSQPKSIGSGINTATHDAGVGLSSDGTMLIIFRTNEELTGGDLYSTYLEGETWEEPIKFGPNINTKWQETSASLSADGSEMYFSSNRPGGYGGKDIYKVERLQHGDWSLPKNLGKVINTPYDDDAPFIHPDGKTLYYSSKGHKTMGGYDIFKSVFEEVDLAEGSGGAWSEPENLGYPINTVGDDIHFTLSADGIRGYYSSGKEGGYGGQDIYIMHIPYETKLLTIIKGVVTSADSLGKPIKAKMILTEHETQKLEGIYRSNSVTGKYLMVISPNIKYKLSVEAKGYHSHTEYIQFTDQQSFDTIFKQIRLKPQNK